MPILRLDRIGPFVERVRLLGDRLGPIRAVVQSPRDDGMLSYLLGSLDADVRVAFDFRHESWDDVTGLVRVDALDAEPFRYVRLREPPYSDDDLRELAPKLAGPAYVYFRHEDEPTAPAYAERLRELLHPRG
jgi:uncharacterized protein YecE (DUF72 family)